jgi:hypothetical protein
MTSPLALEPRRPLPLGRRLRAMLAVGIAFGLARLTPGKLRAVLEHARRRARPATTAQARTARDAVVSVSLHCAGQGCLQRSIAAALLCRTYGTWPSWRTGVNTAPFEAHAWIEADGHPINETFPPGHYRVLLRVDPLDPTRATTGWPGAAPM